MENGLSMSEGLSREYELARERRSSEQIANYNAIFHFSMRDELLR